MPYPQGLPIHTIWDEIAHLLESTKDLLSLALTCRIFKELIIPDHLEYRYISCDIRRLDIWKLLANRPRLARGVRSVNLIRGTNGHICLPQALTDILDWSLELHTSSLQPTIENLVLFRNALSHMNSLKRFTWNHGRASSEELMEISRVVTSTTHCLEALTVDFTWLWIRLKDRVPLESLSVWSLVTLKKVSIRHPGAAPIHMVLHLCPDIEDLQLIGFDFTISTVSHIMQRAHWNKLRRLYLFSGIPGPVPDFSATITSFLDRHTNLESLYLDLLEDSVPNFPVLGLLKLRSIGSGTRNNEFVLPPFLSNDILSRLVHWQCPIGKIDIHTLPQMDNLESACLQFYDACLPEVHAPFLLKAPNLKRVRLQGYLLEHDQHQELIESFLKHLNGLMHLFCDYSLDGIILRADLHARLDSSFKALSSLGSLTYFRIFEDGDDTSLLVKIQRDDNGLYSTYHPVGLEEAGGDPNCWGNFFSEL